MFAPRLHYPPDHAAVKRIADLNDVAIFEPSAVDKETMGCDWSDCQFWHFFLGPPAAADSFDYRPWLVVAFFYKIVHYNEIAADANSGNYYRTRTAFEKETNLSSRVDASLP
jgi:hypothetical protein